MSAFDTYDLYNILFLDIETVPGYAEFDELSDELQELWGIKCHNLLRKAPGEEVEYEEMAELFRQRAGIYAEFAKIVCISVGFLTRQPGNELPLLRLKSFSNHLEASLLEDFSEMLTKHFNNPEKFALCGHNIKEFDIPYICRRMLINQLPLPRMLDIAGKKPWETKHLLDTLEMWKFGDIKNYTSLRLLTAVFDIPSPKDDISGADVATVYWEDRDLDRIATYCEKDVLATAQLFLRMKRQPLLHQSQVVVVR
ncbi:MAG: ribonuclease H-like domain-containing protein [Saprospiraceae bacterium]|nr:ribonuclease H-like domain-containing protein [Saprospiraceae bacterium]